MSSLVIFVLCFNALAVLLYRLPWGLTGQLPSPNIFFNALGFTFYQAFLSALFGVVLGLLAAPGFASLGRFRRILRWVFLFPNMMSPVLSVLCLLLTIPVFPYGLWGIIIGHVFLNSGLAALWLGEKWFELEERWGPVNATMGGGIGKFYLKIIFPQLWPQIGNTFAVIFSLCLTSFAIPLVFGGGPQNSTLEVLIFERIHTDADITSAIVIGLAQCLGQFAVFILILRPILLKTEYSRSTYSPPRLKPLILGTFLVVAINLIPVLQLIRMALGQGEKFLELAQTTSFAHATQNSLMVGLGTAALTFILLSLLTTRGWHRQLINMPALSGIVVGVGGILLFRTLTFHSRWAMILALLWGHIAVVFLPVLRLSAPQLGNLRNRFEKVLHQLGASPGLSFQKVYLKLGMKTYVAGAVLAGCWSIGEFSVSSMVGTSSATLPVFIQGLLGSYRLELAAGASVFLLVLSVASLTMFEVLTDGLG